ncbi:hypothetical protein VTI28DRAFT_815 [Corynascus sepedonium]
MLITLTPQPLNHTLRTRPVNTLLSLSGTYTKAPRLKMATNMRDAEIKDQLRAQFVGKTLSDVPTPSVVLDFAKLEINCERMLEATERLGLLWRAHIKSHKTTELTRLQVGDIRTTPVSLIVSTIIEAEKILPLLQEYQSHGRPVNVCSVKPSLTLSQLNPTFQLSPNPHAADLHT